MSELTTWCRPRFRCAAVGVAMLALFLSGAGRAEAYLYEVRHDEVAPAPTGVHLTDAYLAGAEGTQTARFTWSSVVPNATYEVYAPGFVVYSDGSTGIYTTETWWHGSASWTWDANESYAVRVRSGYTGQSMGLPSPPEDANPDDIYHYTVYSAGAWAGIPAIHKKVVASENQTCDSRLDLRYGNPTPLDFSFGNRIYRGGLFVGLASDPSRVGRSFLKFALPALPADTYVWSAYVQSYFTRAAVPGNVTVAAQGLTNDSWNAATLKWSTAPALNPANGRKTFGLTYNADGSGATWARWKLYGEISDALAGDGVFSAGLHSTNEATSGWAYFAKQEYDPQLAPCVVYALKAPPEVAGIVLDAYSVTGGTDVAGTVYLNGDAPTGGATVSLSTSDPAVQVPSSLTIPAGQSSGTFQVTTSAVTESTLVTVYAVYGGTTATEQLWVLP